MLGALIPDGAASFASAPLKLISKIESAELLDALSRLGLFPKPRARSQSPYRRSPRRKLTCSWLCSCTGCSIISANAVPSRGRRRARRDIMHLLPSVSYLLPRLPGFDHWTTVAFRFFKLHRRSSRKRILDDFPQAFRCNR